MAADACQHRRECGRGGAVAVGGGSSHVPLLGKLWVYTQPQWGCNWHHGIYDMYDHQSDVWVSLCSIGKLWKWFVSKWEGYPQFQWQFQSPTLIEMCFFFMLWSRDSNSQTASTLGIKPGYSGDIVRIWSIIICLDFVGSHRIADSHFTTQHLRLLSFNCSLAVEARYWKPKELWFQNKWDGDPQLT